MPACSAGGPPDVSRLALTRLPGHRVIAFKTLFRCNIVFALLAHQLQLLIDRWELDSLRT